MLAAFNARCKGNFLFFLCCLINKMINNSIVLIFFVRFLFSFFFFYFFIFFPSFCGLFYIIKINDFLFFSLNYLSSRGSIQSMKLLSRWSYIWLITPPKNAYLLNYDPFDLFLLSYYWNFRLCELNFDVRILYNFMHSANQCIFLRFLFQTNEKLFYFIISNGLVYFQSPKHPICNFHS